VRSRSDGRSSPCAPRTWLFDLDNTLHDASAHIFPRINRAMTAYIGKHLEIDEAAATRLRQHYWQRYGATLLGLIRHHGVDPSHFLRHTHDFPDLARLVVCERGLKSLLHRLPGRKIVFSNAPRAYTEAVLDLVRIASCFDAIYSVERLRYQPKPQLSGFLRVLRGEGLAPQQCIMVEDTLANLKTAKALGMKTVWVSASTRRSPCVDVKVATLFDLPARVGRL
jgi:putative hydrolase of the HAD superfamily